MSTTDALVVDNHGRPTVYYGPPLTEGIPPLVLEGLARRRMVALGQTCPCGTRLQVPNRAARRRARRRSAGVLFVEVAHQDDCAAVSTLLDDYLRETS